MKDSKNIYQLLNQMDINIEDYKKEELSDIEKQRLKDNFRKNKVKKFNLKKFGAIAVALVVVAGISTQTNFAENVYAVAESKISEISYSIGKALGIERNIEPYANVVNQVVENNGIEVKLSDVIIDKDELIFSTITNTNKKVESIMFDYDIFINGKRLINYSATGSSGKIDDSDNLFIDTRCIDVKGIDTERNLDIKIVLKNLEYHIGNSRDKIKGKWKFEFTASGKELSAKTSALPMDYSFKIDNQTYNLNEMRINPVNQKILGKVAGESKDRYQVQLRGHDNLGNKVIFNLSTKSGEDLVFKYENIYGDLPNQVTSITLTPYASKIPEESGKMSNDWKQVGEEFTVNLEE